MAFDGFVLAAITAELQAELIGGRINRVYQPLNDEIHLLIYNNSHNYRLLINASSTNSRIHLSEHEKPNPARPPMFCMLLRKHLEGGRITAIEQPGLERILRIVIAAKDELGNPTNKTLVVEIMGRHSNIILINQKDNRIIDAIKRVPIGVSSVRQVLPGLQYHAPPGFGKVNPLVADSAALPREPNKDILVKKFQGISPELARELLYRTSDTREALRLLRQVVINQEFCPSLCIKEDKWCFSAIELRHLSQDCRCYNSINKLVDYYYRNKTQREQLKRCKQELLRVVQASLKKARRKYRKQEQDYQETFLADQYKRTADLLKANLHLVKDGTAEVEVVDYYQEQMPSVVIELDPSKTAKQNLQQLYNKYEKAKRRQQALDRHLKQTQQEIDYLNSLIWTIESAETIEDCQHVRDELEIAGYLQRAKKRPQSGLQPESQPRQFVSSDGFTILVGRNNRQNDELTLSTASKQDLWLHVKDAPGSHVVIRCRGQIVPENTLIEAAHLAAYYSKARYSSNVPIDYTLVKHVRKPRGAKPGMVIYDNHKTIYITPQPELVEKLKGHCS